MVWPIPKLSLDEAAISHDLGGERAAEQCFFRLWTTGAEQPPTGWLPFVNHSVLG